jgi:hypothetical protein
MSRFVFLYLLIVAAQAAFAAGPKPIYKLDTQENSPQGKILVQYYRVDEAEMGRLAAGEATALLR